MLVFTFVRSYNEVKDISVRAKNVMGEECVPSLIAYYNSIYCVPDDKATVIWAIGQIADDKALNFLYQLQEKFKCTDCVNNNPNEYYEICYETNKAIKLCTQGNITSWMYSNRNEWH